MNLPRPTMRRWLATLACSVALPASLATAQTIPVGYETVNVHADIDSLLALRLQSPTLVAGIFETATENLATDNQVNFSSLLNATKKYVAEQNGPTVRRVVEVLSFSGNTLTLAEAGVITTGESYSIRELKRLSDLLSPDLVPEFNPVEDFNPDTGDLIMIPDGAGGFREYYFSSFPGHTGYFNAGTGAAEDPFVNHTKALIVRRQGMAYSTIFTGEVKVSHTAIPIAQRFNYIGSVLPFGSLATSGLAASLRAGTEANADIVWSQDTFTGELRGYFYSNGSGPGLTPGWRQIGGGNEDQAEISLSPGLAIRRRGILPHTVIINGLPGFHGQ